MKLTLSIEKSAHQNAVAYFEKAKKAKRKLDGLNIALQESESRLKKANELLEKKKKQETTQDELEIQKDVKLHWYEKFRWFHASNGMLVIGGRDATSNETIVKNHMDADDLVFHTDMAGSPFFVIKI